VHLKAGYPAGPVRGSAGVGDFERGPDCDGPALLQLRILDEQRHLPFDEQRRVLQAQHGRRVALLGLLADFLGEANAQLDEVAHQSQRPAADLGVTPIGTRRTP